MFLKAFQVNINLVLELSFMSERVVVIGPSLGYMTEVPLAVWVFSMIFSMGIFYQKGFDAFKKLSKKLMFSLGFIVTLPIALIIVLIRPFVLVRFGTLSSQRIGNFAPDAEVYLCILDQEDFTQARVDFIGCPEPVSNPYLKQMWSRHFNIIPGWLSVMLDKSCRFCARSDIHSVYVDELSKDYKYLLTTPPHLSFTKEETERGRDLLEQMEIPPEASWICIHNRDSAYLDRALPAYQWNYHNYRDFSIQSMLSAANELTKRGYFVIRMGAIQSEMLSISNRMIVDYASSPHRSDFGDIYLSSNCSAYIGSDAGLFALPLIFRKPVSFVNYSLSLADFQLRKGCHTFPFITKHLFHEQKQRFLSVREMFETGLYWVGHSYKFEDAGVKVISNTSDEIRDLAIEVDERLRGQWRPHADDEALQQRFWDMFRKYGSLNDTGNIQTPIGSEFLRQHRYLLD